MISCLMVTQPARLPLAQHAIGDFAAQTHADRELVVLHDGDDAFDAALLATARARPGAAIRVLRAAPGRTLGALRNAAVAAAQGDHVCQWDDDDRHHPARLALQWQALREAGASFCFLVDQLHLFAARGELHWDDWHQEAHPFDLVQGTLLGRRDRLPAYPDQARGEDTGLLLQILRAREPIARLRGVGWCYVYVYHGGNVWDRAHHEAISRAKRLRAAQLLQREALLRARLAEYAPPLGAVSLPHEAGVIRIGA